MCYGILTCIYSPAMKECCALNTMRSDTGSLRCDVITNPSSCFCMKAVYWANWLGTQAGRYRKAITALAHISIELFNTHWQFCCTCEMKFIHPVVNVNKKENKAQFFCYVNQWNAQFSNQCSNSIFVVFYMLRTSWVHYQKDCFTRGFFCKHEKHTIQKLRVRTFFLMMNPLCSKHIEDAKNRIKTLIWKVCVSLVYVA